MTQHNDELVEAARDYISKQYPDTQENLDKVERLEIHDLVTLVNHHYPTGFDGFHEDFTGANGVS
jgi:hypothetical protein